uniref:Uncharacterized protein n=1 Tax=Anguilla anguilla TaxID=7936 RepID=A0A0E9P5A9_ANGAN
MITFLALHRLHIDRMTSPKGR